MENQVRVKRISLRKAVEIIENKRPFGKFMVSKRGWVVGIVNQTNEFDINDFTNKSDCQKWLAL